MSRLHLNTEITAMPDSDKPRPPRPPRQRKREFLRNLFGNLSTFMGVWEIFGAFPPGPSGGARFHLHTSNFITKQKFD